MEKRYEEELPDGVGLPKEILKIDPRPYVIAPTDEYDPFDPPHCY